MTNKMKKYAVIGDVHGEFELLQKLLEKIFKMGYEPVFVGDLQDRGKKSKEVIELVRKNDYKMVLGNHDDMMIRMYDYIKKYVENENDIYAKQMIQNWFNQRNGFFQTVASYGFGRIEKNEYGFEKMFFNIESKGFKLFEEDVKWLKTKPYYLKLEGTKANGREIIVSHSYISDVWDDIENIEKKEYIADKIIWGRGTPKDIAGIYNVFGHTPVFLTPEIKEYYANIDTGCGKNGVLSALLIPELEYIN